MPNSHHKQQITACPQGRRWRPRPPLPHQLWECPAPPGHLQECVRPEDNIPSPKALQPQGHPAGPGVAAGVGKAGWPVKQVAGSSWESRMLSWAGRQPQAHGTLRKEDLCPPSL